MNLRLVNIKQLGGVHPPNTIALRGKALDHFPLIEHAFLTLRDGKIEDFGPNEPNVLKTKRPLKT